MKVGGRSVAGAVSPLARQLQELYFLGKHYQRTLMNKQRESQNNEPFGR